MRGRFEFGEVEGSRDAVQGLRGTVEATFDVTNAVTIPAPQQAGQVLGRELLENALDNISNSRCVRARYHCSAYRKKRNHSSNGLCRPIPALVVLFILF